MTIPPPASPFRWTDEPWGPTLRCDPLSAVAQHLFTTRTLGLRAGGGGHAAEWAAVSRALEAEDFPVARVHQVHGHAVRVVRAPKGGGDDRPDADAMISVERGVVLAVQVADCVPVLLADARTGAVAAVHAGWRGTCARVVSETVGAMVREFATRPEDVTAAIGPSIGACCYEVGPELLERFEDAGHPPETRARWFARVTDEASGPGGSLRLDVALANQDQLAAAGVRPDRIFACGLCTKCHPDIFDSFRAAGTAAGRMVAAIACR